MGERKKTLGIQIRRKCLKEKEKEGATTKEKKKYEREKSIRKKRKRERQREKEKRNFLSPSCFQRISFSHVISLSFFHFLHLFPSNILEEGFKKFLCFVEAFRTSL